MNIELTEAETNTILNALQDKARESRKTVVHLLNSIPSTEQAESMGEAPTFTSNGMRSVAMIADDNEDRYWRLFDKFVVASAAFERSY